MSYGLLTEYLQTFLFERLLPIDQELFEEINSWFQKAYAAWYLINKINPKMEQSKELIKKQVGDFDNKFFFLISESVDDFYDLIDNEVWDIEAGKSKAKKTYEKTYEDEYLEDEKLALKISLKEGTSTLKMSIFWEKESLIEKEYEFDLSNPDERYGPYKASHMFSEQISKESPNLISDEHEDARYEFEDWEAEKKDWEEKRAGFEPKGSDGTSEKLFKFDIDGVESKLIAKLMDGAPKDRAAHFSAQGEFGYVVVFAEHIGGSSSNLKTYVEHELRHAFQYRNSETGYFDKIERGLPPRRVQTKHADQSGYPKSSDERIEHHLRDVEFQTNLGDMWISLKKILSRWNDYPNLRDILFRALLQGESGSDLDRILQKYDLNLDERQAIASTFEIYIRSFWRLPAMKKDATGKWKAYIKMLYQLYQREF